MGTTETIPQSATRTQKPHFAVLDGLRGVAALSVVVFHFAELVTGDYARLWIGHGWLAVDFFFCLSGFVIGYAYDDRIAKMGLGNFFKARLIRLHPLVVLGSVLGLIAFYLNPYGHLAAYGPGRMTIVFAASILLIPYGALHGRNTSIFGLNAPSWSLFWEYIANIAFAIALYRLRRGALIVFTVIAAIVLCWSGHHAGNLYGGWNTTTFWYGGVRVAFSFSAGLLVYRLGWRPRTPLGFMSLSVLLIAALIMPFADGGWKREAAVIIVAFPILVALGAGAKISPRMERLCKFSGDLSYPLYMTHYTVIWIWGTYAGRHHLASAALWTDIAFGTLMLIAFAWTVFKLYDQPLRGWLQTKLRAAMKQTPARA